MKYLYILLAAVGFSGAFLFASNSDKPRTPVEVLKAQFAARQAAEKAAASLTPAVSVVAETAASENSSLPPKAIVEERQHEFGVMAIGAELEHEFIVKNEGGSPLKLSKGKTSCKCTIANLDQAEILPGKSAPVHLTWQPRKRDENFRQTATIRTNDPANESIQFVIHGRVEPRLVVEPGWMWSIGDVRTDQGATITGLVYSAVEADFKLLKLQAKPSTSKMVISPLHVIEQERLRQSLSAKQIAGRLHAPPAKTSFVPLSAQRLKDLGAKSGYELKVEFAPGGMQGLFREDLSLHTNLKGDEVLTCMVVGRRIGTYSILPPDGFAWDDSQNSLDLGRFEAAKGKRIQLTFAMLDAANAHIEMSAHECDPAVIRCNWQPDRHTSASHRSRYILTVEIPPGQPPMTFNRDKPAFVRFATNHASFGGLELKVFFSSY